MLQNKFIYIFIFCFILSGCAKPPQQQEVISKARRIQYLQQLQHWNASGRIAINDGNQNVNAAFSWQQKDGTYRIHFYSAFSTESVTIIGDAHQFRVIANNGEQPHDVQLEQHLPFIQMSSWLKGMQAAGTTPDKIKYDSQNQMQSLQQDGWLIEFQTYQNCEPMSMPEKLTITNGFTKAKVLIKNWQK